jgi:hypothetical protein
LRLNHLAEVCGVDPFELDAFLICPAPALDLRCERLYGYLQADVTRRRASVNLVPDLLCEPGPERLLPLARFSDDAPLFAYGLLKRMPEPAGAQPSLLAEALAADEAIVAGCWGNIAHTPTWPATPSWLTRARPRRTACWRARPGRRYGRSCDNNPIYPQCWCSTEGTKRGRKQLLAW